MHTHVRDRIFTLIAIAALVTGASMVYESPEHWQVILAVTLLAGYTHYLIGGYYQWRSIQHRAIPKERRWFFLLACGSALGASIVLWAGYQAEFVLATLLYFILHGYFNEMTLYERQVGARANRATVLATMGVFLGTLCYGIGHPSWFFDASRTFITLSPETIRWYLATDPVPQVARIMGTIVLLGAVGAQAYAWYQRRTARHAVWLALIVTSVAVTLWYWPLPYLVLLTTILLYHFVIWFIFYFRTFYMRDARSVRVYLAQHLGIIGVVLLAYSFLPGGAWLLDIRTFLVLTTVHITVSFLNDEPVRKLLGIHRA
jgi:hypothetical protein